MFTQLLANYLLHNNKPPALQSILPTQASSLIYSGQLPDIVSNKLVLKQGEKCRYVEMGAIITQKKYSYRWNSGTSYKSLFGSRRYVGTGESIPAYELEFTKGLLYFTDKRVVFVAAKHSFDKKIDKLSAISEYSDGIILQFGDKAYILLLPDGIVAKAALDLLV